MLVSAIADKDAFFVFDFVGIALGVVGGEGWIVFTAAFESCREVSRRIDRAEENLGEGGASRLAGILHFDVGRHVIEPVARIDITA